MQICQSPVCLCEQEQTQLCRRSWCREELPGKPEQASCCGLVLGQVQRRWATPQGLAWNKKTLCPLT